MAATPSTDTDPFRLGVGARRAARTRAVGAADMVRGRRPGHLARPGRRRNVTLTTDTRALIWRRHRGGHVDRRAAARTGHAAGGASGPRARCPARPSPSSRPSPRRRPLGGAGVRAGGRPDRHHLAPIASRRSLLASYSREAFRSPDGWLDTKRPVGAPRCTPPPPPPEPPTPCAGWSWATADRDRDGPSSSPGAPDASEEPRPLSFADAPVTAVLLDPA